MTDAELIEWLRKPYGDAMMERAADRIEALIAERNDWESHAIYNAEFVDLAVSYRNERDAAQAKLAKAVEALGRAKASIEGGGGGGVVDVVWLDGPCPETLCDFIDATLAELKGENHE